MPEKGDMVPWSAQRQALQAWALAWGEHQRAMHAAALAQHRMRYAEPGARAYLAEHGPTRVERNNDAPLIVHVDSAGLFALEVES